MTKLIATTLLLSALLIPLPSIAQSEFIDGTHYAATPIQLSTSDKTKIEVMELFSYSCPHCFRLDPQIEAWKKTLPESVNFVRVPAIFRDSWLQLARVFYTAEATGDLDALHPLIFNAIHIEKRQLQTEAQLLEFITEQGIDRSNFIKIMESGDIVAKVKNALLLSQTSGITGVPSMIVNGLYRTDALLAGGMEKMLDSTDFLIGKELENRLK